MITKAALLEDLGRAGIDPHGMLLCHFSMKKIGPVENGADTVLDALMEYMKNGLLIVPCHTWSNVDDENPVFDVRETKPCVGLLPDLFRRREGYTERGFSGGGAPPENVRRMLKNCEILFSLLIFPAIRLK